MLSYFFLLTLPLPHLSTLFPYTTLFRSTFYTIVIGLITTLVFGAATWVLSRDVTSPLRDRKSTRLNSSHLVSSYAVCSWKKKNYNCNVELRTENLIYYRGMREKETGWLI